MEALRQKLAQLGFRGDLGLGVFSGFFVNILGMGVGLGLQVVLTRFMGLADYGTYSYVVAWMGVLVTPAVLGVDAALVRFIPQHVSGSEPQELRGLLRASFSYVMVSSAVIAVVAAMIANILLTPEKEPLRQAFLVGCLMLPLWALSNTRQAALRGFKQSFMARFPDIVLRPCVMMLGVWVLWRALDGKVPAVAAMRVHLLAVLLALLLGFWWLRRITPETVREAVPRYRHRNWISAAGVLMLVSSLYGLMLDLDKVVLGSIQGEIVVGPYAVAARVSLLLLFGFDSVNIIAMPLLAEWFSSKREQLQELVRIVARVTALSTLPIALVLFIFGRQVLGIFGADFVLAYIPMMLLLIGNLSVILLGPVGPLLIMTGHERISIKILIVTLVVQAGLLIPAVHLWGVVGAASVTAGAVILRHLACWVAVKKKLGIGSALWE